MQSAKKSLQRTGWVTNHPGGLHPANPPPAPPVQHPETGQEEPERKLFSSEGCRTELQRLRRHLGSCWCGLKASTTQWQLLQKPEEHSQESRNGIMAPKKQREGGFWQYIGDPLPHTKAQATGKR